MSYEDQWELATTNPTFRGRLSSCVAEQAKVFVNDARPEFYSLAQTAILSNSTVTDQMLPLVTTQPGMTEASTDGDLMSAVQALWAVVGSRYVGV
jgi:hypothetical protein